MKTKTVYCCRIRFDDTQPWSDPTYYRTRKDRNYDERISRIVGGARTYSYEEKKTQEEIDALCE